MELRAKNGGIKGYKSMPINKLLSILDLSEPIKENPEENKTIREIKENRDEDKIRRGLDFLFERLD